MENKECIFCNFTDKTTQIYEDDLCYAVISKDPVNKHHALVVSKEHYESFTELPDKLISHIFSIVKKISKAIKKASNPDAVTYVSEDDISGSGYNLVSHYKFHIIPRFKKDMPLIDWSPLRKDEDVTARSQYAQEVKEYLV